MKFETKNKKVYHLLWDYLLIALIFHHYTVTVASFHRSAQKTTRENNE